MNANRRRRLRLLLRDLAALAAFASVALSGALPVWAMGAFVAGLVASLIGFRPLAGRGGVAAVLLLICAVALGALVFRGGIDLVIAACSFASLVLAHRMVSEPIARTDHQVLLTALLLLVGGAALTGELWFGACLTVYTVLAALALALLTLEGPKVDQTPMPVRPLMRSIGLTVIVAMLGGTAFFVFFPRLSWNFAARRSGPGLGGNTSGMSDRVRLGGAGDIKTSARVVMRTTLYPDPKKERLDAYWPGRAFQVFDGREWSGTGIAQAPTQRVNLGAGRPGMILQQIELLPGYGARTLVAMERPLVFASPVLVNATGSQRGSLVEVRHEEVHVVEAANAYAYQAYSSPADAKQDLTKLPDLSLYIQLPNLDPRVQKLSDQVVAGETDPVKAGHRLERYLKSNYEYTLELNGDTEDPLADFLFTRRAGHCEHFATALAILLRAQQIPARVVAGFFGGEQIGEVYVLRAGDAHAWVQVFEPGVGWVTLDATPETGRGSQPTPFFSWVTTWYEQLEALWQKRVVDYSFQDQLAIARSLVSPPKESDHKSLDLPPKEAWLAAALVAIAVYLAWRIRQRGPSVRRQHRESRFLDQIEKRLSRAGIVQQAEEPLEELVERLESVRHPIAPAVRAASQAYLSSRFGGGQLDAARRKSLLEAIAAPVPADPPGASKPTARGAENRKQ